MSNRDRALHSLVSNDAMRQVLSGAGGVENETVFDAVFREFTDAIASAAGFTPLRRGRKGVGPGILRVGQPAD